MKKNIWFDEIPVIGNMLPEQAFLKLKAINEHELADEIESELKKVGYKKSFLGLKFKYKDKLWSNTAHSFGFIPKSQIKRGEFIEISHAGMIDADKSMKNSAITISLNQLRVAEYPGGGIHHILVDFSAQNHLGEISENLHFTQTFRAQEGQSVGIIGYPIFSGLNVGNEGVSFKVFTVNVKNEKDSNFLKFLESPTFQTGLKLVKTMQPAIAPLTDMAFNLTTMIAKQHENMAVQDFFMGLDFSSIPTGARLAEGAYIAVQIPESFVTVWDWEEWIYNPSNGQIVNKADKKTLIPYNYIVFGVRKSDE